MARSSGRWPQHPAVDVPTPDVGTTVACVSVAILTRTCANSRMAQEQAGIRVGQGAALSG